MHLAATKGHVETMTLLLTTTGCDPNLKNDVYCYLLHSNVYVLMNGMLHIVGYYSAWYSSISRSK